MEAQRESKIRFYLEPIQKISFDDTKNPSRRKNLIYHKKFQIVFFKILFFIVCIPVITVITCLNPNILIISLPILLIIAAYVLKLKILFQRISKRIKEPIQDLNKGDFISLETRGKIYIYVVLKKSISLYYLKKIDFEEIFSRTSVPALTQFNYSDLTIIKADTLIKRYMRVIPVSFNQGVTYSVNKVA
jgi:hypothetical protein